MVKPPPTRGTTVRRGRRGDPTVRRRRESLGPSGRQLRRLHFGAEAGRPPGRRRACTRIPNAVSGSATVSPATFGVPTPMTAAFGPRSWSRHSLRRARWRQRRPSGRRRLAPLTKATSDGQRQGLPWSLQEGVGSRTRSEAFGRSMERGSPGRAVPVEQVQSGRMFREEQGALEVPSEARSEPRRSR